MQTIHYRVPFGATAALACRPIAKSQRATSTPYSDKVNCPACKALLKAGKWKGVHA